MSNFFETRRELRTWFAANRTRTQVLKIGFRARPNGKACVSLEDAAAEAMCFGWTASRRTAIDSGTYIVSFKPIPLGARWSEADVDLARALIESRRMTKAGKTTFENRADQPKQTRKLDSPSDDDLPPTMLAELKRHSQAWAQFQRMPPSHQSKCTAWVMAAKQEATRANRFGKLLLDLGRPR